MHAPPHPPLVERNEKLSMHHETNLYDVYDMGPLTLLIKWLL